MNYFKPKPTFLSVRFSKLHSNNSASVFLLYLSFILILVANKAYILAPPAYSTQESHPDQQCQQQRTLRITLEVIHLHMRRVPQLNKVRVHHTGNKETD